MGGISGPLGGVSGVCKQGQVEPQEGRLGPTSRAGEEGMGHLAWLRICRAFQKLGLSAAKPRSLLFPKGHPELSGPDPLPRTSLLL